MISILSRKHEQLVFCCHDMENLRINYLEIRLNLIGSLNCPWSFEFLIAIKKVYQVVQFGNSVVACSFFDVNFKTQRHLLPRFSISLWVSLMGHGKLTFYLQTIYLVIKLLKPLRRREHSVDNYALTVYAWINVFVVCPTNYIFSLYFFRFSHADQTR